MPENPVVSVCICSYNHARFLPQTIDSVLSQTFQDFELIIIDDGSSDNSHAILTDYQKRYPEKIHYQWHEGHANRGISASCNIALGRARGQYFAWLGSDDYWFPEKLAKQVRFLTEHPEVGMVYSSAQTLDVAGNLLPVFGAQESITVDAWRSFVVSNPVCASTAMIVHKAFEEVGTFDERLVFSDWELWIRLAAKFPIGFMPEPLAAYRVHGQNISISSKKAATILEHHLAVIETVTAQLPQIDNQLKNQALANVYRRAGLDYFASGVIEEGCRNLSRAAQYLGTPLPAKSDSELITTVVNYAIHMFQATGSDTQQSIHFLQRVFANIAPHLRRQAVAQFHVTNAFISYNQGHYSKVRYCVLRAIISNPRGASSRGVLSIAADAFLGLRIASGLRHLTRMLVSNRPHRRTPVQHSW